MGLEKFLKTVLVGALMMCPFVMLGENTHEGSMVPSDSIAVADSVQPTVSLDADTVFADDAVASGAELVESVADGDIGVHECCHPLVAAIREHWVLAYYVLVAEVTARVDIDVAKRGN